MVELSCIKLTLIWWQDSGLSAGQSSNSQSTGDQDLESLVSGARRSITTPITPVQTAVMLESNPSVILDKKTLRNYTPRESSCLLRQLEEERLYSGRDKTAASSSQFSSLTSRKRGGRGSSEADRDGEAGGTCRSQWSAWSAASSAASFDWHAGSSARARVPPEGASLQSDSPGGPRPYQVTKVQVRAGTAELEEQEDDELDNLRKLLKEGRIAGLDELPPAFTPPSPPSKARAGKERSQVVASPGSSRPAADKRLAPQPPGDDLKPPTPTSTVQFLGGRRVQSVEDISTDSGKLKNVSTDPNISRNPRPAQQVDNLKRSTSMHDHNPSKGNKNYYGLLSAEPLHVAIFQNMLANPTRLKTLPWPS